MIPVRNAGQDEAVYIGENGLQRLAVFGRALGQSRRDIARRDPRQDRPVADLLQIGRNPGRRLRQRALEFLGAGTDVLCHVVEPSIKEKSGG